MGVILYTGKEKLREDDYLWYRNDGFLYMIAINKYQSNYLYDYLEQLFYVSQNEIVPVAQTIKEPTKEEIEHLIKVLELY